MQNSVFPCYDTPDGRARRLNDIRARAHPEKPRPDRHFYRFSKQRHPPVPTTFLPDSVTERPPPDALSDVTAGAAPVWHLSHRPPRPTAAVRDPASARFPFFSVFPDTDMSTQPTPPVTASTNPAPSAAPGTVNSMTGYAHQSADTPLGRLDIEIRAVNSRFTDLHFRLADECRLLEPRLRSAITATVRRGKVECRISLSAAGAAGSAPALNLELLCRLRDLEAQVRRRMPWAHAFSVNDLLQWPGMLDEQTPDAEVLSARCLELAGAALEDFIASRAREGEKLAAVILERVTRMRALIEEVTPSIPAAQAAFQEKLRQRLLEALGSVDDERIRQEVAVFAVRIDVAEELARLTTHLDEVERVLQTGGACGKRLDFLMQELNREANTLGSKSVTSVVSQTAMELKLLIEQMREQVQNLE